MNDETRQERAENKSNKGIAAFLGVIVLLALAIGGYYFLTGREDAGLTPEEEMAALLGLDGEGPVARVDGVEISRDEYRRSVEQMVAAYAAQGADPSDATAAAMIKDEALNALINRQLVVAAAAGSGVTASDEAVEAEFQNVVASLGGTEGLTAALASAGLSEQDLRDDLRNSVLIDAYIGSRVGANDISVSDEEVAGYYEAAAAEMEGEVPPLEEVESLIRSQLIAERQQLLIGTELERLRAEANIEILI